MSRPQWSSRIARIASFVLPQQSRALFWSGRGSAMPWAPDGAIRIKISSRRPFHDATPFGAKCQPPWVETAKTTASSPALCSCAFPCPQMRSVFSVGADTRDHFLAAARQADHLRGEIYPQGTGTTLLSRGAHADIQSAHDRNRPNANSTLDAGAPPHMTRSGLNWEELGAVRYRLAGADENGYPCSVRALMGLSSEASGVHCWVGRVGACLATLGICATGEAGRWISQ